MDIEVQSWADFKNICDTKPLLMQYYDAGFNYILWAVDHTVTFSYKIWKAGYEPLNADADAEAADRSDFESNYKASCNSRVGVKLEPFADPIVKFAGDGMEGVATHGTSTNFDFHLTTTKAVYGAQYFAQNSVMGDSVTFEVVDVDNLLGAGAGYVISKFVDKWYVIPNTFVDVPLPLASTIPAGLYIRVVYNSVGSQDVNMIVNFYMTVKI
jgi:hypothetical protein